MAKKKCKRNIYSGCVLDVEVYTINDGVKNADDIENKLFRPRTAEEKRTANERQAKKRFTRNMNATFSSGGLYVTLTYDNENLPQSYKEAVQNLKNFIRVLRYKFPDAKIMAVTGYGRRSGRLHHHLVVSGVEESFIVKKWNKGLITRIETLRAHNVYNGIDHGRDYTALAHYLFAHAVDRGKGKRWVQTKNISQPEKEEAKEIKRNYSVDKPPRTPKGYILVDAYEGVNGFLNFKYVKIPTYKKAATQQGKFLRI